MTFFCVTSEAEIWIWMPSETTRRWLQTASG